MNKLIVFLMITFVGCSSTNSYVNSDNEATGRNKDSDVRAPASDEKICMGFKLFVKTANALTVLPMLNRENIEWKVYNFLLNEEEFAGISNIVIRGNQTRIKEISQKLKMIDIEGEPRSCTNFDSLETSPIKKADY